MTPARCRKVNEAGYPAPIFAQESINPKLANQLIRDWLIGYQVAWKSGCQDISNQDFRETRSGKVPNQYLLRKTKTEDVTPAKARGPELKSWIPASAGMTNIVSTTGTN